MRPNCVSHSVCGNISPHKNKERGVAMANKDTGELDCASLDLTHLWNFSCNHSRYVVLPVWTGARRGFLFLKPAFVRKYLKIMASPNTSNAKILVYNLDTVGAFDPLGCSACHCLSYIYCFKTERHYSPFFLPSWAKPDEPESRVESEGCFDPGECSNISQNYSMQANRHIRSNHSLVSIPNMLLSRFSTRTNFKRWKLGVGICAIYQIWDHQYTYMT